MQTDPNVFETTTLEVEKPLCAPVVVVQQAAGLLLDPPEVLPVARGQNQRYAGLVQHITWTHVKLIHIIKTPNANFQKSS